MFWAESSRTSWSKRSRRNSRIQRARDRVLYISEALESRRLLSGDDAVVQFALGSDSVREGVGTVLVTVELPNPSGHDVTVPFTISGTASGGGADYSLTGSSILIAAGNASGTISIEIVNDDEAELSETIVLTLGNPANAGQGGIQTHTLTILDNETTTLSVGDASILERDDGMVEMVFTATRLGDLMPTITASYSTADGTATQGSDYVSQSGTVTLASGEATATIRVPVLGDALYELNETFTIHLTPTNDRDFATGTNPYAVGVGDLNGDGRPDLAVANYSSDTVSVFVNTASAGASAPSFAAGQDLVTGSRPRSVSIGDLNGDGMPDLIVVNEYSNTISVFLNTTAIGTSTPSFASRQDISVGNSPLSVSVGDFNGDGRPDLAVSNYNSNTVSVLLNATANLSLAASFVDAPGFPTGSRPYCVSTGDFNGDGRPDLAVTNYDSRSVSVLLNTTSIGAMTPSFALKQDVVAGTEPCLLSVGDLNGDGRPDLAVANNGSHTVSVFLNTTVIGASTTNFVRQDFATGNSPWSVGIGDVNGDGKLDLAVGGSQTVSMLLNTMISGAVAPSFSSRQDITAGTNPYALSLGDFNGDGRSDMAVANWSSNTVSVLMNTTAGGVSIPSFSVRADFATGANPYAVGVGDLNGDGRPDLAVANYSSDTVSVFVNTASAGASAPSFAAGQALVTGSNPQSVSIGDLNGDGRPDLAVANLHSHNVSVFLNTTVIGALTPSFTAGQYISTGSGSGPMGVGIGDFNSDGNADMAVINYWSHTVSVFLNTTADGGSTVSFAAKQDFATGERPESICIADINGDGKPDLAVANEFSATVSVLLNTAAVGASLPSFTAKQDLVVGGAPHSVRAGDINGDGRPDLAVAVYHSDTVQVFLNTTSAGASAPSFATRHSLTTADGPRSLSVEDLNGDGRADLAVANYISGTVSVLWNTTMAGAAVPNFSARQELGTGINPCFVSIGNFNDDGRLDMAVANWSSNTVSVLMNMTAGGASTGTLAAFSSPRDFATGDDPHSVSVGDLNGDGKPDMAVANATSNTVSVLLNTTVGGGSSLSFTVRQDFTTGTSPLSTSIGDLNGDGRPDIALVNHNSHTVSVFLNTTPIGALTPSFANRLDLATGIAPSSVNMGDLNGDGKLDLAVANNGPHTVSVFLNTTAIGAFTASFAARQDIGAGDVPIFVSMGDLNADGKLDMAVANNASNTVSVFLNTTSAGGATISFAARENFSTGTGPRPVSIGDLNGDGRPDLAVCNLASNRVTVLLNTTAGGASKPSFAAGHHFATGNYPYSVSMGDLNGDGKRDLAVANSNSNTVSVLYNTTLAGAATPSFSDKQDLAAAAPLSVSVGDINGDGKLDLAVANAGSDKVSVLLNMAASGVFTPDFASTHEFATGTSPWSVSVGDLNGDGRPDLAVANFNSNTASMFLNTTANAFTPSFLTRQDLVTGGGPVSTFMGDLNADGKLDLVVSNFSSSTLSVFLNTTANVASTLSFAPRQDFATGNEPMRVSVGDLNGDGTLDLAVANYRANTVSVFLNKTAVGASESSFLTRQDFVTGSNPHGISIGDLNGDGRLDLAVTNHTSHTVSVLLNTTAVGATTASFSTRQDFATGTTPLSVSIGDLNGDGRADLAVANRESNTVSVLLNSTTAASMASFAARQDFVTGSSPYSVKIGDLNGDGKLDLAVANANSNTISVLLNTIRGGEVAPSFTARLDFATGATPHSLSIGDLNGDGRLDMAIANWGSSTVTVLTPEWYTNDGVGVGSIIDDDFSALKDIHAGENSSDPASLIDINGTLFLIASTDSGYELWKSDGTAEGTVLVKDIDPGPNSSYPQYLTNVNGSLFFTARTDAGYELWKSDGSAAGTSLVKDIHPGTGGSDPTGLVNVGGTLFFTAYEPASGRELWKSDGTAAGTVLVKDIYAGPHSSYATNLTDVNGMLFFAAYSPDDGWELWKSDGTAVGTMLVKDINPVSGGSGPQSLTAVNGTLFFTAHNPASGRELWKSDGTVAGTTLIRDINPGKLGSDPTSLTNVNGTLFFAATDAISGRELWKSDGLAAGTTMVRDINPGKLGSDPTNLANLSGTLFFSAADAISGKELWKSDGTAAGTVLVCDIAPGSPSSSPTDLTAGNGTLVFTAETIKGRELWVSDGTSGETTLVKDILPGGGGSEPASLIRFNGMLFFAATDKAGGRELWKLPLPQVQLDTDVVRTEGKAGETRAVFTVTLSGFMAWPVSMQYSTSDGTATVGDGDYRPVSGTLTFLPGGPLTQTIVVPIIGDTKIESDDSFVLDLSNAVGATIADGRGIGRILDDDLPRSEFRVNTTTEGIQTHADVAMNAAGQSVVVWWQREANANGGYDVYYQRYDVAGVAQGGENRVNQTTTGTQEEASVAMADDGSFVVCWSGNGPGDGSGVFGQRFDAAGVRLGDEFRVNTYAADHQQEPSVAMDATGDFVVAWSSIGQDGGANLWEVYAQRYSRDGVKLDGEFRLNQIVDNNQLGATLAMGRDGRFVAMWYGQDADGWGVWARWFDADGEAIGDEFPVNQTTAGPQYPTSILLVSPTECLIMWSGTDGDNNGVFMRRFAAPGIPLGDEVRVNMTVPLNQYLGRLAPAGGGGFVAAWSAAGQDGSDYGVYMRRYDAADQPLSGELRVNATTEGEQLCYAIAGDGSGSFMVIWRGNGPGDDGGIFGQRYEMSFLSVRGTTTTTIDTSMPLMFLNIEDTSLVKLTIGSSIVLHTDSLSMGSSALLDLGDNELVVPNGGIAVLDQLTLLVASARNGLADQLWGGPGITTSVATANTGLAVFLRGQDVVVKYTYHGDITGDGRVDGNDYAAMDRGFLTGARGYAAGDIDFDNDIDGDDFFLADAAFLAQSLVLAPVTSADGIGMPTYGGISDPLEGVSTKMASTTGDQPPAAPDGWPQGVFQAMNVIGGYMSVGAEPMLDEALTNSLPVGVRSNKVAARRDAIAGRGSAEFGMGRVPPAALRQSPVMVWARNRVLGKPAPIESWQLLRLRAGELDTVMGGTSAPALHMSAAAAVPAKFSVLRIQYSGELLQ